MTNTNHLSTYTEILKTYERINGGETRLPLDRLIFLIERRIIRPKFAYELYASILKSIEDVEMILDELDPEIEKGEGNEIVPKDNQN